LGLRVTVQVLHFLTGLAAGSFPLPELGDVGFLPSLMLFPSFHYRR
jgi:hypothetical protein